MAICRYRVIHKLLGVMPTADNEQTSGNGSFLMINLGGQRPATHFGMESTKFRMAYEDILGR